STVLLGMVIFHSEEMSRAQDILLVVLTMGFIIGIWGNGLFGIINFTNWVRHRAIIIINLILNSLSTSRICFLILMLIESFLLVLSVHPHSIGPF
ncbi:hypothetical protein KGF47_20835, partial [Clostridioides sp. ZZV13-5731]|nr:hypothetical protein [Clostridioides sp. ZZV13-5731]